jgi:hypothetical protein
VIDAGAFLHAPEAHLRFLCGHFGIGYTPRMLAWPQGPRDSGRRRGSVHAGRRTPARTQPAGLKPCPG